MHPLVDQHDFYWAGNDEAIADLLIRINRRILKETVDVLLHGLLSLFQI